VTDKHGFTLVEVLLAVAILLVFFSAITVISSISVELIGRSKIQAEAVRLAERRLEEAQNLPYADIGTVGGIPDGFFPQSEDVFVNGVTFTLQTQVLYIDDPFDTLSPSDTTPTDYKRVRVSVDWGGALAPQQPLVMLTDISPPGLESDLGGGILSIHVFNASGQSIANADVSVRADTLVPPVNLNTLTDAQGKVDLPGATPCIECYEITVTKSGYTTDKTYSRTQVTNPSQPHLSVFASQTTESSFTIDTVSMMTFKAVRSKQFNFNPFQGVQMKVRGTKEIGRTAQNDPVYKFDQLITTGTGGQVTVNNMEWDTYYVTLPSGSSVDKTASWPFSPFSLLPGSNLTFTLVVEASSPNNLLMMIRDNFQAPIASASVTLRNDLVSYIATKSTGLSNDPDRAQVFFANTPATNEAYTVTIISPGFIDVVNQATISGKVEDNYLLSPLP